MSDQKRKENKMGIMPIPKLLLDVSLPMMASMLVQALYNIVDSIFVGSISEDALSAVSYAFPIQNLMIALSVGTGVGVNALVSRHLGAKDYKQANQVATNGLVLSIITSIIFSIVVFCFNGPFFRFFTNNQTIVKYGMDYARIVGGFCYALFIQAFLEKMLQSTGRTRLSMITQMTGAITNVILDPIMIFGLFGFPRMEVTGAALATVIGQTVAAIVAVFMNVYKNKELHISLRKYPVSLSIIKSIYAIGLPSIIMMAVSSVMNFGMNKVLGKFSDTAVAVFGAYYKLQSFIFMPVIGLNNGMLPIVAYNFGARKPERIKATLKLAVKVAVCIMTVGVLLFLFLPAQLLGLFSASDQMIAIGAPALRIISTHFIVAGYCIICTSSFQALGHGMLSLIVSASRQLLVLLPVAFVFGSLFGLTSVWWSFPIAELASATLCTIFLRKMLREEIEPLYQSTPIS
ncbi:MAG: MATE family efflux transporter [Lachnospiraceae bacterium]|jgi:putative MATE family efflux protein|nr:MATE family efflux transporter [Lachnospiraceae bacterium]